MKQIQVPTWQECSERIDNLERTDRTISASVFHGYELTPLENMVYNYDDSNPANSRQYMKDIKELVEWCINNPIQVLAKHEKL